MTRQLVIQMKFQELPIQKELIEITKKHDFTDLTAIQERCVPEILNGKDIVGQAETGSGKTIAFSLPLIDKLKGSDLQVLVLTPTRELCVQVSDVFTEYAKPLGFTTTSVYGGVKIEPQIRSLPRSHIVVGTPGRILDHINRKTINLKNIRHLVFDETDKMFEMGFIDDVEEIIHHIPPRRQTLMFSATITPEIERLVKRHQNNPLIIKTQSYVDTSKLKQEYYDIYQQNNKFSILVHLLKNISSGLSIVFCATRKESDIVSRNLKRQGINAAAIHGGMTQGKRSESLNQLKNQQIDVLVATDVAARGLDIKNVTHIFNYDVPKTSKEYVHRIGRTARAGEHGSAITLLTQRDHDNFRRVQSDEDLDIARKEIPLFKKVPFIREIQQRKMPMRHKGYHRSFRR
jgi:ATP-dependent RNA helicase DeaD